MNSSSRQPTARAGWGSAIDSASDRAGSAAAGSRSDSYRLVDLADQPAEYSRWMRRWTWPAVLAVAVMFGMMTGGIDVWRAVLMSLGIAVALWSVIATMSTGRVNWHDDVPGARYRASSTWEVPGLAGARESDTAFAQYLRPRLWAIAEDLLRARGIDPTSAQARKLVGSRHYDLLTGADTDHRRTTSSVSVLCQTIARLAVDPHAGSRPPIDTPALTGLAGGPRSRTTDSFRRSRSGSNSGSNSGLGSGRGRRSAAAHVKGPHA
ncbi:MAG: hypothetical protein ABI382_06525 [Nakamurella sp.]